MFGASCAFVLLLAASSTSWTGAMAQPVESYLPSDAVFDASIPKPEEVIGHHVGEWHVTHDRLVRYMEEVAEASDRISIRTIGHTHEGRRQVQLTITSPSNHARLEQVRERHQSLLDPSRSGSLPIEEMPVVISMNYSIHGNEPSGSNASMAVVYYMAAAQGERVERMLEQSVILLDPSLNPDGLQRFSTWVNMHKGATPNGDPAHREYDEVWPGGRTNHYWFDMNRDWLPVQQPESRARVAAYHEFRPNILTDHHEMGTDATFFFQPGIPSRTNPLTLQANQDLTARIAEYHAGRLNAIGSLYYSEESFDDFYYGKGSTFPDIQGSIGILFEQASSRGHLQESINGPVGFPFTIRNQVETSISTWEAGVGLRVELLEHMRSSIAEQVAQATRGEVKGYVVGAAADRSLNWHFADILAMQQVEFAPLSRDLTLSGQRFEQGKAWVIPAAQPQARLIQAMFDRSTSFEDSLFYDVSAWTLPYAFNLPFAEITGRTEIGSLMGDQQRMPEKPSGTVETGGSGYAWAFEWDDYYAPKVLYRLLDAGIRARVASRPFTASTSGGLMAFDYGTVVIPAGIQTMGREALEEILEEAAGHGGVAIHSIETGLTGSGPDLGSRLMEPVVKPSVAVLAGEGVSSSEAGEVWHLLDTRFGIPVSLVDPGRLGAIDLSRYNVLVVPSGWFGGAEGRSGESVRDWVRSGGTLIVQRGALQWARGAGLLSAGSLRGNDDEEGTPERRPYVKASEDRGSRAMGGSIFFGKADLTHPIAYGLPSDRIALFRSSTDLIEMPDNPYATPIVYDQNPLAAGYVHPDLLSRIGGTPAVVIEGVGSGAVVAFADNPNFRAFWFGTNRLFLNAVFFGRTIDRATRN